MEKTFYIDLTNVRNFFNLVIHEGNASREEVFNFLQECLNFVFIANELDITEYDITIHAVKRMLSQNQGAYMYKGVKPNEFHVHFLKETMVLKTLDNESLTELLRLIIMAFHEYGHIIQYIKSEDFMNEFDNNYIGVYKFLNNYLPLCERKEQNLITKQFLKHQEAKALISVVEKDANSQSYEYFKSMINALKSTETDEALIHLYDIILKFINQTKKFRHMEYRIGNKENREALNILQQHGFGKDDLLI